ncbi:hypothetical protein BDZ85DRAFT_59057 [Elsinoe ampelina]|uniref:BZIP domain-containing protein n=1 Tax=Elsinoe ampelina TaxID=302913 RepID=A0A6A6GN21_9PEZI|nr:hypothetical protein BDZ85DRAFT_59057 [Elsinoe ampelina]
MTPPQTDSGASSPVGGGSVTSKAKAEKISNLVRTRENQRRSRARRREYIAGLEAKYRRYEAMGAEASVEIQQAARKVLEENRRLRSIIQEYGLKVEENEERPTEKVESLLSRKRTLEDDGTLPTGRSIALKPASGLEEVAERSASVVAAARPTIGTAQSSVTATPQPQRQQLTLVTPKIEPGLETFDHDGWESDSANMQTPLRQMASGQEAWSAPPTGPSHPYQAQQNWAPHITGMSLDAQELAAAAGLSLSDPSIRYLLTDPDTLLKQMYGLPAESYQQSQRQVGYQSLTGPASSHSDAEFHWGISQPQHHPSASQQQQHPQMAHSQHPSQMNTPQMGVPQPHQQIQHQTNHQYPQGQGQMYPPPGYQYPQR